MHTYNVHDELCFCSVRVSETKGHVSYDSIYMQHSESEEPSRPTAETGFPVRAMKMFGNEMGGWGGVAR